MSNWSEWCLQTLVSSLHVKSHLFEASDVCDQGPGSEALRSSGRGLLNGKQAFPFKSTGFKPATNASDLVNTKRSLEGLTMSYNFLMTDTWNNNHIKK